MNVKDLKASLEFSASNGGSTQKQVSFQRKTKRPWDPSQQKEGNQSPDSSTNQNPAPPSPGRSEKAESRVVFKRKFGAPEPLQADTKTKGKEEGDKNLTETKVVFQEENGEENPEETKKYQRSLSRSMERTRIRRLSRLSRGNTALNELGAEEEAKIAKKKEEEAAVYTANKLSEKCYEIQGHINNLGNQLDSLTQNLNSQSHEHFKLSKEFSIENQTLNLKSIQLEKTRFKISELAAKNQLLASVIEEKMKEIQTEASNCEQIDQKTKETQEKSVICKAESEELTKEVLRLKAIEKKVKDGESFASEQARNSQKRSLLELKAILEENQKKLRRLKHHYMRITALSLTHFLDKSVLKRLRAVFTSLAFDQTCEELVTKKISHCLQISKEYYGKLLRISMKKWRDSAVKGKKINERVKELSVAMHNRRIMNQFYRKWRSAFDIANMKKLLAFQALRVAFQIYSKHEKSRQLKCFFSRWADFKERKSHLDALSRVTVRIKRKLHEREGLWRLQNNAKARNMERTIKSCLSKLFIHKQLFWGFEKIKKKHRKSIMKESKEKQKAWLAWRSFVFSRKNKKKAQKVFRVLHTKENKRNLLTSFGRWRAHFIERNSEKERRALEIMRNKAREGKKAFEESKRSFLKREQVVWLEKLRRKVELKTRKVMFSSLRNNSVRKHLEGAVLSTLFRVGKEFHLRRAMTVLWVFAENRNKTSLQKNTRSMVLKLQSKSCHKIAFESSLRERKEKESSPSSFNHQNLRLILHARTGKTNVITLFRSLHEAHSRATGRALGTLKSFVERKKTHSMKYLAIQEGRNRRLLRGKITLWWRAFLRAQKHKDISKNSQVYFKIHQKKLMLKTFYEFKKFESLKKHTKKFLLRCLMVKRRQEKLYFLSKWKELCMEMRVIDEETHFEEAEIYLDESELSIEKGKKAIDEARKDLNEDREQYMEMNVLIGLRKIRNATQRKKLFFTNLVLLAKRKRDLERKLERFVCKSVPRLAVRLGFRDIKNHEFSVKIKGVFELNKQEKLLFRETKSEGDEAIRKIKGEIEGHKGFIGESQVSIKKNKALVRKINGKFELMYQIRKNQEKLGRLFSVWKIIHIKDRKFWSLVQKATDRSEKFRAFSEIKRKAQSFDINFQKKKTLREVTGKAQVKITRQAFRKLIQRSFETWAVTLQTEENPIREEMELTGDLELQAKRKRDICVLEFFEKRMLKRFYHRFESTFRSLKEKQKRKEKRDGNLRRLRLLRAYVAFKKRIVYQRKTKEREMKIKEKTDKMTLLRHWEAIRDCFESHEKVKGIFECSKKLVNEKKRDCFYKWHRKAAFFSVERNRKLKTGSIKLTKSIERLLKKTKKSTILALFRFPLNLISGSHRVGHLFSDVKARTLSKALWDMRKYSRFRKTIQERVEENGELQRAAMNKMHWKIRKNEMEAFLKRNKLDFDLFQTQKEAKLKQVWLQVISRSKLKGNGSSSLVKGFQGLKLRLLRKKRAKTILRNILLKNFEKESPCSAFLKWVSLSKLTKKLFVEMPIEECNKTVRKEFMKNKIFEEEVQEITKAEGEFLGLMRTMRKIKESAQKRAARRLISCFSDKRTGFKQWKTHSDAIKYFCNEEMYMSASERLESLMAEVLRAEEHQASIESENDRLRAVLEDNCKTQARIQELLVEKEKLSLQIVDQSSLMETVLRDNTSCREAVEQLIQNGKELRDFAMGLEEEFETDVLMRLDQTLRQFGSFKREMEF